MRGVRTRRLLEWRPLLQSVREELVLAPLEPVLHPSPRRLWWVGFSLFAGNALFAWIWLAWLPQPYENPVLRAVASVLGFSLMTRKISSRPASSLTQWIFGLVLWLELPVFFSWMYLCNSGNTVWLAAVTAMVLSYYHVTDWRLATVGTITGSLVAGSLFYSFGPRVPLMPGDQYAIHAVVLAFAWSIALVLSLSSANLRRDQLNRTLSTIGIMAHELRTPLSTAALLGDAILLEVQRQPDNPRAAQLEKLGSRLHALVRNMNHQIATQIANAKLQQLPRYDDIVSAADLTRSVVKLYPYSTSRQQACVKLVIYKDFKFRSSLTQFSQVLDNLIKNALHSLLVADSRFLPGALRIDIDVVEGRGHIRITDDGMGIDSSILPQIFKPFFSGDSAPGHGLGLPFCQQVIQSAGGSIQVKSEYAIGATFTIALPLAQ